MLISYPVLPFAAANADEEIYLDNITAAHLLDNEGRYPVSTIQSPAGPIHRWHGGVHLTGNGEPIRAIADGTVVAFRAAQQRENYDGLGEYDTSFVLLRHETQSGENTTVVFYSLYMHLASRNDLAADRFAQLPQWLRQAAPGSNVQTPANQRVWRKDVLGFAGQLYGRETCHFEVFTTDAALTVFWRDSTTVTQSAGSADFFGDAHFVIPANQTFRDRHPRAAAAGAHRIDLGGHANFPLDVGQSGNNAAALYVSVKLRAGRRIATTYRAGPNDTFTQVGQPVVQDNYEYELYRLATALYPDCPSAGLEWLRFGRVLGTDTTTRNENWQLVRYSEGAIGYIDLAPNAIVKLSDADFVHWQGWRKRDEGQTVRAADGICDDAPTIALSQATDEQSKRRLRHFICKAPSEWDAADLATRYARLREPNGPLSSQESWNKFEQHVQKMAFWANSGLAERNVWHFQPLQFINHYRKCGWLSDDDLSLMIPRYSFYERVGNVYQAHTAGPAGVYQVTRQGARTRLQNYFRPLNQTMRKYGIQSRVRQGHFLAQTILETDRWRTMREYGRGATNHAIPMAQYYAAFYGRGIMQLTWAANYRDYGSFRATVGLPDHNGTYADTRIGAQSVHWTGAPGEGGTQQIRWSPRFDPDVIATNANAACDSGGFYWASKMIGAGAHNINAVCDRGTTPDAVGRVSVLVNGGGNGYIERQAYAQYLFRYLTDDTATTSPVEYQSARGRVSVNFEKPQ